MWKNQTKDYRIYTIFRSSETPQSTLNTLAFEIFVDLLMKAIIEGPFRYEL